MTSVWPRGELIRRVLRPALLESAEPAALADGNLRDIAGINSWFGGHRILLRVLKDLAPPQSQFSVLDVGAGSSDMGECIRRCFQDARVVSVDHRSFYPRNAPGRQVGADAFQLPFLPKAFDFVLI
jgi:hypothetical protein